MTTTLTPDRHSEAAFESVIEAQVLEHGYRSLPSGYDRARALFPDVVTGFIKATQPKEWAKLEALHGANTSARVLDDLCKWLETYGALHTLRHGFKCYGRTLRVAFFKAAHELNVDLEARYAANILGLTRQLRYSERTGAREKQGVLDLTISLNGIPNHHARTQKPLHWANS